MSQPAADLLIELGTEELPPTALRKLSNAFTAAVTKGLQDSRLGAGDVRAFATPRRLAVVVDSVELAQQDRQVTQKGPPVRIAFDADGAATKAGLAFAKKCGVEVSVLSRETAGADEVLVHTSTERGRAAAELIPEIVQAACDALPIPRRMRWGSYSDEFVRPAHWLIMLHGDDVVAGTVLNVESGRVTHGHRFQSADGTEPGQIEIASPDTYSATLQKRGFVIADLQERLDLIVASVNKAASEAGGDAVADDALFEEVAALTEWPVTITGTFDAAFLALPKEVVIETLTRHQRYFPVQDKNGDLLPVFITLANLESKQPDRVRDGNERVIRPRLADAVFFWETDQQTPLGDRADTLKKVVYQQGLGTLHDKSVRVANIAAFLADLGNIDSGLVKRAAELAKCDLVTGMVGEFPELQGVMGQYYATAADEPAEICQAIREQYLPRFAGDVLPQSVTGQLLAVADRLDTLAGIFLLGKKPTGNRDPFGLRRAALGVVRVLIEKQLDINLADALAFAASQQPPVDNAKASSNEENLAALNNYVTERLRGYFVDEENDFSSDMFAAVKDRHPSSLSDFHARLRAVADFLALDAAVSLAAANKRTANILRKADMQDDAPTPAVATELLQDVAEQNLFEALQAAQTDVQPLLQSRDYTTALRRLADLRAPIDRFFDDVMVMADDEALQKNRLALLAQLRALFLGVADISRLTPAQV